MGRRTKLIRGEVDSDQQGGVSDALLERELLRLLGGDAKAQVVARYWGFDGLGGATLQAVGAEFRITAERVRQILGEVVKRVAGRRTAAPALEAALGYIAQRVPAWADVLESGLPAAGISIHSFRVESLLRAAALFGRRAGFCVTNTAKARLVHALSPLLLEAVVRVARRAIERGGIATIKTLLEDLRETVPQAVDGRVAAAVLAVVEDLQWLDQVSEWFWLPGVSRNPVLNRVRKVLSVANPVQSAELWSAIAREYHLQGYSPPREVLLELCRQASGLRVEGMLVEADPPIDPREVLGETEAAIFEVLAAHGGLMPRTNLAGACIQRGVNRTSFHHCVTRSPVVVLHGGLVGLVGRQPAVQEVQESSAKPRSKYLRATKNGETVGLHRLMERPAGRRSS